MSQKYIPLHAGTHALLAELQQHRELEKQLRELVEEMWNYQEHRPGSHPLMCVRKLEALLSKLGVPP